MAIVSGENEGRRWKWGGKRKVADL